MHVFFITFCVCVFQSVDYDMEVYGCPIVIPYSQDFRPTIELYVIAISDISTIMLFVGVQVR